jgi:hypothetical protein
LAQRPQAKLSRRAALAATAALTMGGAACGLLPSLAKGERMLTVYTFGDSILDCGHYNP